MPQRYDQHFLRDENIARAIAEAACPSPMRFCWKSALAQVSSLSTLYSGLTPSLA